MSVEEFNQAVALIKSGQKASALEILTRLTQVEPGNVSAMREAIRFLLSNPAEAKRLGNARQRVLEELNLETYVSSIASVLMASELAGKYSDARLGLPVA